MKPGKDYPVNLMEAILGATKAIKTGDYTVGGRRAKETSGYPINSIGLIVLGVALVLTALCMLIF